MRMEIVEAVRGLHKIEAVSETEVTKTTLRMLGKDALPKVERMSPSQIVAVREKTGVFVLVFFAITNLRQFLCGYRRLDLSLIEREIQPSDMPPFLKFVVVDVRPLVLRKPEQKYGAFAPAVRRSRCEIRRSFLVLDVRRAA
jgi:hypothetical protein